MIFGEKNQKCTLITVNEVADSSGFMDEEATTEKRKKIWCKVSSVTGQEIASFGQNNIHPSIRVTVWAREYDGQTEVEVDGQRYGVYRTYQPGMDEVELYLEKKAGVGNWQA